MKKIIFTTTDKETNKVSTKEITHDSDGYPITDKSEYFAIARDNIFKREIERNTILYDSTTKVEWESITSFLSLELIETSF